MTTSIESLVHRSLRNLENFKSEENSEAWPLLKEEKLIGVYFNKENDLVGVSTFGLRPLKNLLVRYSEIAEASVENSKNDAEEINLLLVDGRTLKVRFTGGSGRFRDVWEVVRFLDRARKHMNARANQ